MRKGSLKATEQGIQRLNEALVRANQSKLVLAEQLGIARSTVSNLFSGKSIAYEKLDTICEALSLDWQEIASHIEAEHQEEHKDNTNVDTLVKGVREKVRSSIEECCATMRVLDMTYPIGLRDIYTDVNILEKITGRRYKEIAELMQECSLEDFERVGMGRITQERVPGIEAVEKYTKLIILGKPGAGKTTFLKYVALQCNTGKFKPKHVPIFVTLKDFAEAAKKPELLEYINHQFASCGIAATEVIYLLKQGRVVVLLDGLDEVKEEDSKHVLKEIRNFSNQFRDNHFLITCRIAAQEYIFDKFTEVEVADFDIRQIREFANNWFQGNQEKRENFIKRLNCNNKITEIATNPLLITLLCLVFEESGSFPRSRCQLYKEGIDIMLKKWDAKRGIERDQVYKNISPQRKEELLSKIALTTFEQGNYFFKQKVVEKYITDYICNLFGANTDPKALQLDSEIMLRSIEAQHGLLVERAKGIYSFSHLTFHEYLTSVEIVFRTNPLDKLEERLLPHIVEQRWREVFLLTSELLSNADELLKSMKDKIDQLLTADNYLQKFLKKINEKSTSIKVSQKSKLAAVRAFYFDIDFNIDQKRLLGERIDKKTNNLLVCASFLSRVLKETSLNAAIDLAKKSDVDYQGSITNASSANRVMKVAVKIALDSEQLEAGMREKLQKLQKKLYEGDSEEEKLGKLADDLRAAAKNKQRMGNDWQFNDEQKELMKQYYNANLLLMECLSTDCYVNVNIRKEIEDRLLLPVDEIEKKESTRTEVEGECKG